MNSHHNHLYRRTLQGSLGESGDAVSLSEGCITLGIESAPPAQWIRISIEYANDTVLTRIGNIPMNAKVIVPLQQSSSSLFAHWESSWRSYKLLDVICNSFLRGESQGTYVWDYNGIRTVKESAVLTVEDPRVSKILFHCGDEREYPNYSRSDSLRCRRRNGTRRIALPHGNHKMLNHLAALVR